MRSKSYELGGGIHFGQRRSITLYAKARHFGLFDFNVSDESVFDNKVLGAFEHEVEAEYGAMVKYDLRRKSFAPCLGR